MSPRSWQMIEGGAIAAATFAATIALGLHWWLPLALFLAWDLSALGYGLKHDDAFQHTHLGWIGKRNGDSAPH